MNEELKTHLEQLINKAPVMIFIKGNPTFPQCGFSGKIIQILKEHEVEFDYFDIYSDENVRQALKEYSNWPTFPQLYVKGELIGGVDIVNEMHEAGELADLFAKI